MPYRVRTRWDQFRIESALRGVLDSSPSPAVESALASAEVHMLLCHRDFLSGIVALKSLLKAVPHPLAVAVTSDGTLSEDERRSLNWHIPGTRWLEWPEVDSRQNSLGDIYPKLMALYSSAYQPSAKLLHPLLHSRCERVIVLDPDTVSWRRLSLLTDWVDGRVDQDLHLQDLSCRVPDIPAAAVKAFHEFSRSLPSEHRRWQIENLFFNSGLLAFHCSRMHLSVAERYLDWHSREAAAINCPLKEIWFGDWTPEQTCYLVMFATQSLQPRPLGEQYLLGFRPDVEFNHFLRTGLVRCETLLRLRDFIANELHS